MAYTNNVPQANQQIAATQGPILANFGFIQTDAQVEHIFNGNTGPLGATQAEGTHIKASMPNQNLLAALPSGTDGVYYVNNGKATFYDGTNNYVISQLQAVHGQTAVIIGAAFQILPAGNYFGTVNCVRNDVNNDYTSLQFYLNAGTLVVNVISQDTTNIFLQLDGSGNLQLKNTGSANYIFTWQVIYTLVP